MYLRIFIYGLICGILQMHLNFSKQLTNYDLEIVRGK